MNNSAFGVMVVAVDKGNDFPEGAGSKALWPILDKPMIGYLLKTILECGAEDVCVVVDNGDGDIFEYLKSFPSVIPIKFESPEYRLWLKRFPNALVMNCDLPFLGAETIRSFMARAEAGRTFLGPVPLTGQSDADGPTIRKAPLRSDDAPAIRNQAELALATAKMRDAIVFKWMEKGVRVMDPRSVWIGPDVTLECGVSIMPGAQIWGNSFVGRNSAVGPYCILRNATLGREVNLIANVIVEDSQLRDHAKAGPFAYIRDGSVLNERSFAGKFVEIKKTSVGSGSKVPHLSYMGDAVLGDNVNIGAGSVTCNYDGTNKFQTRIGDRCFVGSDTMMVAPVTLGDDSMTAAGSTITEDVPSGALALGRARQKNIEGWALRRKQLKSNKS